MGVKRKEVCRNLKERVLRFGKGVGFKIVEKFTLYTMVVCVSVVLHGFGPHLEAVAFLNPNCLSDWSELGKLRTREEGSCLLSD
ncbi:hypothetical protein V6N13_029936 [Hibiscus sabdariffa]|uniref:Uncharacterized protein n=1 Tax=Hibiscus sabdariffa TaxID=183260 RepID=A0ABR2T8I4_9ROSI